MPYSPPPFLNVLRNTESVVATIEGYKVGLEENITHDLKVHRGGLKAREAV